MKSYIIIVFLLVIFFVSSFIGYNKYIELSDCEVKLNKISSRLDNIDKEMKSVLEEGGNIMNYLSSYFNLSGDITLSQLKSLLTELGKKEHNLITEHKKTITELKAISGILMKRNVEIQEQQLKINKLSYNYQLQTRLLNKLISLQDFIKFTSSASSSPSYIHYTNKAIAIRSPTKLFITCKSSNTDDQSTLTLNFSNETSSQIYDTLREVFLSRAEMRNKYDSIIILVNDNIDKLLSSSSRRFLGKLGFSNLAAIKPKESYIGYFNKYQGILIDRKSDPSTISISSKLVGCKDIERTGIIIN